jgi:hypothetical protein
MYDRSDITSLALVGWREDRGDGIEGCQAVMNVVCNRIGYPGFARNLHDVVYGKNEFTSMSDPNNPEFRLYPDAADLLWVCCLRFACQLLSSKGAIDPSRGAHYYADLTYITPDGWFQKFVLDMPAKHPHTVTIGRQSYYL